MRDGKDETLIYQCHRKAGLTRRIIHAGRIALLAAVAAANAKADDGTEADAGEPALSYQSGYGSAPGFGGPSSVSEQIWIGWQIYDGNAVSGDFDWDTFDQHEWLKSLEIGWSLSFDRRNRDRVQFTWWEKDAWLETGVPTGAGSTMNTWWRRHTSFSYRRTFH
jgi:hypothetical protein